MKLRSLVLATTLCVAACGAGPTPNADAGDGGGDVPIIPPGSACAPPIAAVDTSTPATIVGSGAGTCTEAAFDAALAQGGIITFDCGGAATIPFTSQKTLPDRDTVIDGGGQVTLDGGGTTRLFYFDGGNYRTTATTFTFQHVTIAHGRSNGTPLTNTAPRPCSQGVDTDGGGAGLYVRDGVLHVIDATFIDNEAAALGPDVGGGAIYALGSIETIVTDSVFSGNSGSNSGAIGSLQSDLTVVNSTFSNNHALGSGANGDDPSSGCPPQPNGTNAVGSGGNGGAIAIDGADNGTIVFCGDVFSGNDGRAFGGAIFRTPNGAAQTTRIDKTTFDGNRALAGMTLPDGTVESGGGGALYFHNSVLEITNSTFSGNSSARGGGALQADGTMLVFTNVTISGNSAVDGLGGGILLFGNGGTLTNCTLADNHADGGPGLFGAAIGGGTTIALENTIVAGNTTQDPWTPMSCHGGGAGSHDLQWPENHLVGGSPDDPCAPGILFADPMLGPLADNGGPTLTRMPMAAPSAIQTGANCPSQDQTGRPRATPCTLGAVER